MSGTTPNRYRLSDRLQMQGEVAKHFAASVEAAVKGALKQMQKAR